MRDSESASTVSHRIICYSRLCLRFLDSLEGRYPSQENATLWTNCVKNRVKLARAWSGITQISKGIAIRQWCERLAKCPSGFLPYFHITYRENGVFVPVQKFNCDFTPVILKRMSSLTLIWMSVI